MKETDFFWFKGMKVDNPSYLEAVARIDANIEKTGYVCFVEAVSIVLGHIDSELMTALNNSIMSLPDGMPLVWYGRLLGIRKIERLSGPEVFRDFIERHAEYKHFLLGDTPETIRQVISKATAGNRSLRISGYSPPFRPELTEQDNAIILNIISRANPDIIWVSFGLVKQAKWMYKIAPRLERGIMMGVGAAFKFYTGAIPQLPRFVQLMGLNWVSRIADRPEFFFRNIRNRIKFLCYFPGEFIQARIRGRGRGGRD